ncbi:MAG: dTDP-4-dehydrorhamnose 3,5-epimerase [Patescibacteria group bacterium]|nr:dTDP-4-dehydrorhamnose 3,5-epimerase [Patescibacteria group bacterium]
MDNLITLGEIMPFKNVIQGSEDIAKASGKLIIQRLKLPEVLLIQPRNVFNDRRGLFAETYRYGDLAKVVDGMPMMIQTNLSVSNPFTLRGLHYQLHEPQGKLVQIAAGKIFDVAVDLRRSSPNFGKWCGVVLDAKNPASVYVPPKFAHGFFSFEQGAVVIYQTTTYHDSASDRTVRWDCPEIGISWPIGPGGMTIMSGKDRNALPLTEVETFE